MGVASRTARAQPLLLHNEPATVMATRGRGGIDQMDLGGDVDYRELERRQGEVATARGYGKPEVGIAHKTDISYDKDSSVFREWKDQSLWAGLPDVDKVYYNPNIDDHTLWRPRCDIFDRSRADCAWSSNCQAFRGRTFTCRSRTICSRSAP